MEEVFKILGVFFTSTVKFLPAPFMAGGAGFSFWFSVLVTSLGGITGTFFFYSMAGFFMKRAKAKRKEGKKVFTVFNKLAVWAKTRIGLTGIALLTPIIFSIPVGAIISAKFFRNSAATVWVLSASVVFWSLVLSLFSSGIF